MTLWLVYVPMAYAQILDNGTLNTVGGAGYGSGAQTPLPVIIGNLIKIFIGALGIIFLLLTIYAGYLWLIARGDEKMVEKSKETLKTSVIGLVIITAAYAIAAFVINALVVSTSATP